VAPFIKSNQTFSVSASDSFTVTGVADPDGDDVAMRWTLMEEATGQSFSGKGPRVSVKPSASPGLYQLLITADDGRGGVTEAVAKVDIKAAAAIQAAALRAQGQSSAAAAMPAQTLAPSIYVGRLAETPKLQSLTFYQGAVLDLYAAATGLFDLSSPSWMNDLKTATCIWTLKGQTEEAAAGGATVYGCTSPARFRLHTPGAYTLNFEATDKQSGEMKTASSIITVVEKPAWADHYTSASAEAFASGRCDDAYFFGTEFTPLGLACKGVSLLPGWGSELGAGAAKELEFSWKLTPLTQRAAAAHRQPLTKASKGTGRAGFGAVAPGLYHAEVVGAAGGAGGGSTSSINTVYYLSTILVVDTTSHVRLPPPPSMCAGKAVKLAPARLALLHGQTADAPKWKVAWADARAATGKPMLLSGSGSSFTFTTQPGRYYATVTIDVNEPGTVPRRLTGRALVEARPCFKCAPSAATLAAARDHCGASARDVLKLLAEPRPPWLGSAHLSFAPASDLRPGTRPLTLVARSAATNVTADCTVPAVTIRDVTPPRVKLRRQGGECVSPANGRWSCFGSAALVTAFDACAGLKPIEFLASCGAGTTQATCRVLPDGRVCLRAAPPRGRAASHAAQVDLLFRDGFGNAVAAPFKVPVTVLRSGGEGCHEPTIEQLPA